MSRPLSPIERMIDAATGYKPGSRPAPAWVTLRCPSCERTKQVYGHETDPPNTKIVEALCDKCDHGGDKPETIYFNASGQQIHGETGDPIETLNRKLPR